MSEDKRIESFQEFWVFYAGEHRSPTNRFLHYLGTTSGLALIITAMAMQIWWLLALAPIFGYGHAWVGHFWIEKNKPASFAYPGWSFLGDLKMLSFALQGKMGTEMERLYGSRHPAPDAPRRVHF